MMNNAGTASANAPLPGSPSKKKKPMTRPPPKNVVTHAGAASLPMHELNATSTTTHSHYTHESTITTHTRPPLRMSLTSSASGSSSSSTSSSSAIHPHLSQGPAGRSLSAASASGASGAGVGASSNSHVTSSSYHIDVVDDERGYHEDNEDDENYDGQVDRNNNHTKNNKRARRRRRRRHSSTSGPSTTVRKPGLYGKAHIKGRYKLVRMILLTTSLMGLQFTWAVEMAYGTPFLLQLGLSKSLMSLVWLAGPLSGLVMQPVVGVLSDRCTSRFGRRRPFLAVGVAAVVGSFLCLGWCREIMAFVFGQDYASLDVVTILMAVASIYILDFAINCVQASCRTLIVDSLPSSQQEEAAAWASRLMGLGGIFGYFMGNVNLPEVLPAFGDTQIKGLCIVACLFLVLNVGLTCWAVTERVMVRSTSTSASSVSELFGGFKSIFQSIRHLPLQIQRLCNVQFFAWMGWFPFLFYSSTYIAEIYTRERLAQDTGEGTDSGPPSAELNDAAVRAGSYCLLVYSIVSLAASMLLPIFVAPTLPSHSSSSSSTPVSPSTGGGRLYRLFGGQDRNASKPWWHQLKPRWLPIPWLTLPRMYTLSLALLSFALLTTWLIQDIRGSTILFSLCGIAWAVSMWAPFSILGEVISQQLQEQQHRERMRGAIGTGDQVETMFDADVDVDHDNEDDDDETMQGVVVEGEDGQEEIRMVENKRYRPVSLHAAESTFSPPSTIQTSITSQGVSGLDTNGGVASWEHSNRRGHVHGNPSLASIDTITSDGLRENHLHQSDDIQHEDNSGGRGSMDEETLGDGDEEVQKLVNTTSSSSMHRRVSDIENNSPRVSGGGEAAGSVTSSVGTSAGALLGIHNIYIVLPQFLVSFLSSLVFAAIEGGKKSTSDGADGTGTGQDVPNSTGAADGDQPADPNTIGVMLRFGGLMAGIAALLSLRLWRAPALGGRW